MEQLPPKQTTRGQAGLLSWSLSQPLSVAQDPLKKHVFFKVFFAEMFFVASTTKCDSGRAIGAKRRICKYIPGSKQIFIESLAVSSDSEKKKSFRVDCECGMAGRSACTIG